MGVVRYILHPLRLARQLSMFGPRPLGGGQSSAPQMGLLNAPLHREVHHVAGHVRQTQHGIVQVAPHQRNVAVASTAPVRHDDGMKAPMPEPTPEAAPEPMSSQERAGRMRALIDRIDMLERDTQIDAVTRSHAITEARRQIAALERRTVAEIVGQDATITSEPIVNDVGTPAEMLEAAAQTAKLNEPDTYTYVRAAPKDGEEAVNYLPPGASDLQTLPDGSTMITYATPLHHADRAALRLEPYDRDPSDAERGIGALRPGRAYFAVLDDKMDAFQASMERLTKKAKRFKNGAAPTAEAVGTGRARVPIAVDRAADGTIKGLRYATLPYTLMKVDGGRIQVTGGWKLQAKITPLAHGVNEVQAVGNTNGVKLPEELWRSGMYCDHCKTNRDRSLLYAFQDPKGTWKRCGSSCLQDFIGMTPAAVAAAAESMDILDDGERFDDWLRSDADVGTGWSRDYMPFDAVLALASAAVEEDGGYVSRAEADKAAVMSTGDRVMRDLARPESLTRKVYDDPSHLAFAREVIDWLRTQPQDTDYMRNLGAYTMAGAVNLKRKGPGLAVSAIAAYLNAKEREADAARPEAGWFGKPGEKFGPKYLPTKTGKPGQHQHAPRLVKVTKTYATMSDFGPSTKVSMVDDAGHRFVWWASGSAGDNYQPGQVVQIAGGSIKKHTSWKPRGSEVHQNETQLTRASLTPVVTAEQSRFVAERSERLKADNEVMRAGFDAVRARMERELPGVQEAVDADPDMEGVPPYTRMRIAHKRWVESLPREDIAMIPTDDNARHDLDASDMRQPP